MLDFFEWVLCKHRQKYHNEDYQERIEYLISKSIVQEMAEILPEPEDWWSP